MEYETSSTCIKAPQCEWHADHGDCAIRKVRWAVIILGNPAAHECSATGNLQRGGM